MARHPSLFLTVAALVAMPPVPASVVPLSGVARAVDGDTIAFGPQRVRIWGIDAPEKLQPCLDRGGRRWACGQRARAALGDRIAGHRVVCRPRDRDDHGRPVATCVIGGEDLAGWVVRAGWAFDYPRYSGGAYLGGERAARAMRRNIWAGSVTAPWLWRAAQRQAVAPAVPPSPACALKGNINAKGGRIVHAPGQRDYAAVRIDPARGERWFCSLEAARAAGWRPAAR